MAENTVLDPYVPPSRQYAMIPQFCEHCDGLDQRHMMDNSGQHLSWGRVDYLRGAICPSCDKAFDKLEKEKD